MERTGYLYISDLFYVQTVRLRPKLAGQPFWIDLGGRVLAYSPALDGLGIRAGTPARQARRIAPDATVVEYRPEDFQPVHELFCEIAYRFTPVVEPFRPGEIFLGLQAPDARDIARTLAAEARDLGFQGIVTVARSRLTGRLLGRELAFSNRLAAERAGTERRGVAWLEPDDHAPFMAPRPVECLWTLPRKVRERLNRLGLFKVADVQRIHRQALSARFGRDAGAALFEAARGLDTRPVSAIWPPESLTVEERFDAMDNREAAYQRLSALSAQLAEKLRENFKTCRRLRLDVLEEGKLLPASESMALNPPASGVNRIYLAARRLFDRLPLCHPVESVTLCAGDLSAACAHQLDLFTPLRVLEGQKEEFKAFLTLRFGSGTLKLGAQAGITWRERMLGFY